MSTNSAATGSADPAVFDSRAPRRSPTGAGKAVGGAGKFMDDRLGGAKFFRESLNKVFPDNWSFMIGEIALYSFIILLLTGTYLTLFFQDSTAEVLYHGSYRQLQGVPMSAAYASTLHISFDVRAGLLIRQIHHWAALLFIAGMIVHACRVFFTGAYRKPRELNWLIGVGLVTLGLLEGFAGYSLPDDLLSGTGLRIADAVIQSIPVVGTWVGFLLFGGEYPGTHIIERLYVVHILIVPGLILGLISAHMGLLWHQKHTQFPGPGRTENNVVGERMFPVYGAKAGGFFMLVFAMLALLGGLFQINPVWLYGPYSPANVSAGSQPDFYIGFLEGSLRIMPPWEFRAWGYDIPFMILIPGVVIPGIMFTLFALWPWIEQRMTGDRAYHNLLQRPRESPVRAGAGMMALTFYGVLVASGANDVFASIFHISLNVTTWIGRVLIIVLPPIAYVVTKKICEALNRSDAAKRDHGYETGIIRRLPSGEVIEVHAPLPVAGTPALTPVETTTFAELSRAQHGAAHEDGELVAVGAPAGSGSDDESGVAGFFGIGKRS
ncbi:MAG TPA: ubiquinol-cytochrome c reductase cytochrome b subunit [Mycobacteriales bacterium]|jgi:ubiquinol-cytochrome c reductase cytochrome b subunit|nr:ubiquinol-cytochrome c reductase cytochrome b subunit [Mycobacteriales bacterium]